jgi:predicted nucleotide-binding protein
MPYYHIRLKYQEAGQTFESTDYELDLSEEDAKEFGKQYEDGMVFFKGKWIKAICIKEIEVRETQSMSKHYYPPLAPSTIFYGDRSDIGIVTRKFIKSPPEELKISEKREKAKQLISKSILVVHGRDDKPKLELARMLEKLGLHPIILSEEADRGRTIIEKLEDETIDIGYAFVILTPDDLALPNTLSLLSPLPPELPFKHRARQNVILELGYLIGKIGRKRVCCLYKGDIELPSDIHGVLYKKFEKSVEECYRGILEELKAAGYEIKL